MHNHKIANQGLSNPTIENTGVTINALGKLGTCGNFDGQSYINIPVSVITNNTTDFSICCWIKFNTLNRAETVFSSCVDNIGVALVKLASNNLRFDCGAEIDQWTITDYDIPINEWIHICVTRNSTERCLYINGIFISRTRNAGISENDATIVSIGKGIEGTLNGCMNDFRYYDHTLSTKELQTISQGLILSYPMGNIDGQIGGRNYILNGKGDLKSGFFKYFTKVSNGYGEHTLTSMNNYTSINITQGFVIECREYIVGEIVTMSYDFMYTNWDFPEGTKINELWIGQRYTNSTNITDSTTGIWRRITQHNLPVVGTDGCEINKWIHIEKTMTIPEQASSDVGASASLTFQNPNKTISASITFRIKNVKIERSNKETLWTPAPEDIPQFYDNTIYDTSGLANNGFVTDSTIPAWSDDSPRYSGSYVFNGSNKIQTNHPIFYDDVNQCHTVCAWVNLAAHVNNQTLINLNHNYYLTFHSNDLFKTIMYVNHGQNDAYVYGDQLPLNEWVHITWVLDTAAYRCEVYYNGVLNAKSNNYKSPDLPLGVNKNLIIGENFIGKLSDLRIYATALSASDIQSLYKTSASVAKNGTLLLAGEVIEK